MVQATPGVSELAKALAKAQGSFPPIPKNKTTTVKTKSGGQYTYNYADLPSILDLTRKPLSENGLSISQMTMVHDGAMVLLTRLMHSSGEYIEATYPLPIGALAQDMGSAITYARRYSLAPIIGIAPDDDDDGKAAQENEAKPSVPQKPASNVIPGFGKQPKPKEEKKPEPDKNAGLATVVVQSIQPDKVNGVDCSRIKTTGGDFLVDVRKATAKDILKAANESSQSKANVIIDFFTTDAGNSVVKTLQVEG